MTEDSHSQYDTPGVPHSCFSKEWPMVSHCCKAQFADKVVSAVLMSDAVSVSSELMFK